MCEWKFSKSTDLLCFYLISSPDFQTPTLSLDALSQPEDFLLLISPQEEFKVLTGFPAIPHSGIASNRNFLLFFLPWILRSVLHSGMSYPLSAAFDYIQPNTALFVYTPVAPLICFAYMFLMAKSRNSPKWLSFLLCSTFHVPICKYI